MNTDLHLHSAIVHQIPVLDNVQVQTLYVLYLELKDRRCISKPRITWVTTPNEMSVYEFQVVLMVSNCSFITH